MGTLKDTELYKIAQEVTKKGTHFTEYNFIDLIEELESHLNQSDISEEIDYTLKDLVEQRKCAYLFMKNTTIKKAKQNLKGVKFALLTNNFIMLFSCLRNLFENSIYFAYYNNILFAVIRESLNNLQAKNRLNKSLSFEECKKELINELNQVRQIYNIKEKEIKQITEGLHNLPYDNTVAEELYALFDNYLRYNVYSLYRIRTRFDLGKYFTFRFNSIDELYKKELIEDSLEDYEFQINVLDCINTLIKEISFYYALNCEMVHPNKGSHMLVLKDFKANKLKIGNLDRDMTKTLFLMVVSPIFHQIYYLITDTLK